MPHTFFRFTIQGVVQGVGFRPFIYRACSKAGLVGYVENTGTGVVVVVNDAETFRDILKQLPAHMRIDSVKSEATQGRWTDFTIAESSGSGFSEIPPDLFLCELCLAELGEKSNRRHDYFFLTCTACGPRFTLAQKSPYDRATTSMQAFALCPACETEYRDPDNRRFHAQTIACPQCGPTLTLLLDNQPLGLPDSAIFERVAQALGQGEIVAIKGVGGFHLFSSTQTPSIVKLNTLTGRRQKPYAVLCRDMAMARTLATPTAEEERQLLSSQRPIVLVAKTPDAPEVSELDTIGIMLASTALHMLLFKYYPHPPYLHFRQSRPCSSHHAALRAIRPTRTRS
jgi:hydrogenase maturation protein HypF